MNEEERALTALLAQLWLRHGAAAKARTLLRGAALLAPGDRELVKLRAWAEVACGDGEAGIDAVEAYRRLDPFAGDESPIELIRARALLLQGRPAEARQVFARFVAARRGAGPGARGGG